MKMANYVVVVEGAIECDNKFLIIQRPAGVHAGGLLSFAGGKVEAQDEKYDRDILRSALKREIFEELGLRLEGELKYITSSYFLETDGTCVIDNIFHYKYDSLPVVTASEREVPWFGWMSPEQIHNASNSPDWLKNYISMIIK